MALIKCPKCGKEISDSAVKCVHCGTDLSELKKQGEISNEYSLLKEEEQKKIREEYETVHPELTYYEKSVKKLAISSFVLFFLGMLVGIAEAVVEIFFENLTLRIILILLMLVFGGVGIIPFLIYKKHNRILIKEKKKFQFWLKNEKGLTYNLVLSEKDRKIYNEIDID